MQLEDLFGLQATFYITLAYVITIYGLSKTTKIDPINVLFWILITTGLLHGLGGSIVTFQKTSQYGYLVLEAVNTFLALVSAVMAVRIKYLEKKPKEKKKTVDKK